MDLDKTFQSKIFKTTTIITVSVVIFLAIFSLGVFVGFRKANFAYRWGENYHRNFAGPKRGFIDNFKEFEKGDLIDSHGVVGKIIKVENTSIIIQGRNDLEKMIIINKDTKIKKFNTDIGAKDLKVNDMVIIIGEPNDSGQIEAKLIRLMPPPLSGQMPNRSFPPESFN